MSELKVYIHPLKKSMMGNTIVGQSYYLKSEADKYIDLLKDKANYNEYAYKLKSEELADTCRFYEEELRHHKFKRCLDKAKWCHDKWNMSLGWDPTEGDTAHFFLHYQKWEKRWLEIAEKLKEAK